MLKKLDVYVLVLHPTDQTFYGQIIKQQQTLCHVQCRHPSTFEGFYSDPKGVVKVVTGYMGVDLQRVNTILHQRALMTIFKGLSSW